MHINLSKKCQQYIPQKHNRTKRVTLHKEKALILLLLQEAQDQTLVVVPPEEFVNAEVKFYTGSPLQHEYKKVSNYYCVNLIFSLHNNHFYPSTLMTNQFHNHSDKPHLYTVSSFLWKRR